MNLDNVCHVNTEVMLSGAAKKPYNLSRQLFNIAGA